MTTTTSGGREDELEAGREELPPTLFLSDFLDPERNEGLVGILGTLDEEIYEMTVDDLRRMLEGFVDEPE